MAANSDPDSYGETVVYTFPSGRNIDGPTQVFAQINQDPVFSAQRTLLGSGGSTIVFGDFLVIPINDSLLYVQPVYVRSNQESSIPELKRVLVVNGDRVGDREQPVRGVVRLDRRGSPSDGGGEPPRRVHRRAGRGAAQPGAAAFRGRRCGVDGRQPRHVPVRAQPGAGPGAAGERPGGRAGRNRRYRLADAVTVSRARRPSRRPQGSGRVGTRGRRRCRRRPSAPSAGGPSSPSSSPASA